MNYNFFCRTGSGGIWLKIAGQYQRRDGNSYDSAEQVLKFNRDQSGLGPQGERRTGISLINGKLKLRIFVDKSSIEIFINEGEK